MRRKELRLRLRSWQVNAGGQSSNEIRFCLSHFLCSRTRSKTTGLQASPKFSFGDARFVKAIRSLATDAAASRPMMSTTTGLVSIAVVAPVAERLSPSSRCFLSLTRTTVCYRAVRHCGDTLWSIPPGKRQHLRLKIRIACPIPPHSAAGPAGWTAPNRPFPFSVKRSLTWLTGWRAVIQPITKLGLCPG